MRVVQSKNLHQSTLHKIYSNARATFSKLFILSISAFASLQLNTTKTNRNKIISSNSIRSGAKRKYVTVKGSEDTGSASTGLTQEIYIMEIGSSTPKRRKSQSPPKGALKTRYVQHSRFIIMRVIESMKIKSRISQRIV